MAFPVDNTKVNLTGVYGARSPIELPNGKLSGSFHYAVDLAPEKRGTQLPVYAVGRGRVHSTGYRADAGHYIILELAGDGSLWRYCHLSGIGVGAGQTLQDGERIGQMGKSGNATGVHLHLERYPSGQLVKRVDPWPYIYPEPNPVGYPVNKPGAAEKPAKPTPPPKAATPKRTPKIGSKIKLSTPWVRYTHATLTGRMRTNLPAGTYSVVGISRGNYRLKGSGYDGWVHAAAAAGLL